MFTRSREVAMQEIEAAAVCGCNIVHEDKVKAALAATPSEDELKSLGELFKVFADPGRLKILSALAETELCVCDLSAVLGATQSAVSHQLALLRAASLVKYRRDGKTVYYSLADSHVRAILLVGLDHVGEEGGKK
jgi:ArsR family transcriptional regulator, lead/cadmium/zinc/bismuth-responsive transcriptional repressor